MAPKNYVRRTVQYWRLVDARTSLNAPEVDWHTVITKRLYGKRHTFDLEGREHAGTVMALNVGDAWTDAFDLSDVPKAPPLLDPETTYGIVLAAGKDYVPNQANVSDGSQAPMSLNGDEWEPVDNLFVTFLPFGNLIGVLAESTSSSRATKFVDWLNRATAGMWAETDFAWAVRPVVDPSRANLLGQAHGLKSAVFAGELGSQVNPASGIRDIFFPSDDDAPNVQQIRIEVKASVVRGKSGPEDEQAILDWFNDNFGSLDGAVDKAQVTIAPSDSTGPTEVDLLRHRLTRKSNVMLATGASRAFAGKTAVEAIVDAFVLDRADLLRLRNADI